ncbi:MAG: nitrous oxide-stimulated promoter family protein [Dehalogenimonas sp.]|uniref:Nitrous oxide-stimulated promoter family protein n=1 Tax=Candidatus Dehalogenimonas loeffleri TaxID=3127115 RepID=A0ABZ2J5E6_9CHLR|nr:nitrous oxide-stimulated promoter family protein [Dehalogenimonas sp.]
MSAGKLKQYTVNAEGLFKERPRLRRETITILVMIDMYCRSHHQQPDNCLECRELGEYAVKRLDKCPFGEGKTVCALCPVHCYKPELRQRVREVMRYAGPRMTLRHPLMALTHIIDRRRKKPLDFLRPDSP